MSTVIRGDIAPFSPEMAVREPARGPDGAPDTALAELLPGGPRCDDANECTGASFRRRRPGRARRPGTTNPRPGAHCRLRAGADRGHVIVNQQFVGLGEGRRR